MAKAYQVRQVLQAMRHADLAMYQAKEAGRGQVKLFTQDMLDSLSSRAALEAAGFRHIELRDRNPEIAARNRAEVAKLEALRDATGETVILGKLQGLGVVKTWTGPTSNEKVTVTFKQAIGKADALRTATAEADRRVQGRRDDAARRLLGRRSRQRHDRPHARSG